jgi:hypothetical protein
LKIIKYQRKGCINVRSDTERGRLLTFHHLPITNVSRRATGNADFAFNELLVEGKEVVVSRPSVRV